MKSTIVFVILCIFCSFLKPSNSMAMNLVLEDGSYPGVVGAEAQFRYAYNTSSRNGLFTVSLANKSAQVTVDGVLVTPKVTAFLFNLPQGVTGVSFLGASSAGGGGAASPVTGWRFPSAGMQSGHIPSPDNHGFWDAGASVGMRFTSGSPDNGIPPGMTYMFDFRLTGDVDELTIGSILASGPSFSGGSGGGSGSGGGPGGRGGGGGQHSGGLTSDEGGGGPPSLDWSVYFLANVKGSPEGVFDFPLLVPDDVAAQPAAHAPEPCSAALIVLGLAYGACRRFRSRTSDS